MIAPASDVAAAVVDALIERKLTIAIAESLTGGLVVAELIRIPGASATVLGGIVAYSSALKHSLLGVSQELLSAHGPVQSEVARQMAAGVRVALTVNGRPADVGISTTGVAGPGAQDGQAAGTVYLGIAIGEVVSSLRLELSGDREAIRTATVSELLIQLKNTLGSV